MMKLGMMKLEMEGGDGEKDNKEGNAEYLSEGIMFSGHHSISHHESLG